MRSWEITIHSVENWPIQQKAGKTIQTRVRLSLTKQQTRKPAAHKLFLKITPNHQNQVIIFVSSDNFLALLFYITASLFLLRLFLHRTDPFAPLFYSTSLILPTLEINITLA